MDWRRFVPAGLRRTLARSNGVGCALVVEGAFGLRWLRSEDGSVQGLVDAPAPRRLQLEYTRVMLAALGFAPPGRVLVAGLGAGALPQAIARIVPGASIDVVEIDPQVVALARAHLLFQQSINTTVHVADVAAFLNASGARWSLVLLDAYVGERVPEALSSEAFLMQARDHLEPGGAAAANVWGPDRSAGYPAVLASWKRVFPHVRVLRCAHTSNRIFVGTQERRDVGEVLRKLVDLPGAGAIPSDAWDAVRALAG